MSPAVAGALVGLAFAAAEYVWFGALLRGARQRSNVGRGPAILDGIRKAQLLVFPLIGWFAGPIVASGIGGR